VTWVVYRMTVGGRVPGVNAVCEQGEWDAIQRQQPGCHTLIRAGIDNEGEAERLARGGPGYATDADPWPFARRHRTAGAGRADRPRAVHRRRSRT